MSPALSMMNPLPAPRLGVSNCRGSSVGGRRKRCPPIVETRLEAVASTFTTAALIRSATSAKFAVPDAGRTAGRRMPGSSVYRGAVVTTVLGVNCPARMRPTRNAMIDVSAMVMTVNLRMCSPAAAPACRASGGSLRL